MAVFCHLFHVYHEKLQYYAYTILKDGDAAEDIVQTVFLKLWEKKDRLLALEKIGSYLYKSTYNLSLNYKRDHKTRDIREKEGSSTINPMVDQINEEILATELSLRINRVLEELPSQCRIIFLKSRTEGRKYLEIAKDLNLSVKTVEVQMGKALRILRERLKEYL